MKKEMTMEMRLLLAFLLRGLFIFGTQFFYKPPPPQAPGKPASTKTAEANTPSASSQAPAAAAAPAAEMPGQIQAAQEDSFTVDTDLYHVVFSNRGAVVKSWLLKSYK